MAQQGQSPDVRQLETGKLPVGKFPGDGASDFRVFVHPDVQKQILVHAGENSTVEICGILVGQWQKDERGPYVAITNSIRGGAATSKFAEVTFTHETWAKINKEMDEKFADKSIVGWYHTHPDFGIFLSDRDRFIHEHFFSGPGQIAYVVDPVRHEEGIFSWKGGKTKRVEYYWIGDKLEISSQNEHDRDSLPKHENRSNDDKKSSSPSSRFEKIPAASYEPWYGAGRLTVIFAALGLFFLGYFLQGRLSGWEQQRLIEGTVFHYSTIKGMTLLLPQKMDALAKGIHTIEDDLAQLSDEQEKKDKDPQLRTSWEKSLANLKTVEHETLELRDQYTLTPDEEAAYERYIVGKTAATAMPNVQVVTQNPAPEPPRQLTTAPASTTPSKSK